MQNQDTTMDIDEDGGIEVTSTTESDSTTITDHSNTTILNGVEDRNNNKGLTCVGKSTTVLVKVSKKNGKQHATMIDCFTKKARDSDLSESMESAREEIHQLDEEDTKVENETEHETEHETDLIKQRSDVELLEKNEIDKTSNGNIMPDRELDSNTDDDDDDDDGDDNDDDDDDDYYESNKVDNPTRTKITYKQKAKKNSDSILNQNYDTKSIQQDDKTIFDFDEDDNVRKNNDNDSNKDETVINSQQEEDGDKDENDTKSTILTNDYFSDEHVNKSNNLEENELSLKEELQNFKSRAKSLPTKRRRKSKTKLKYLRREEREQQKKTKKVGVGSGKSRSSRICPYCNERKSVYGFLNHRNKCERIYEECKERGEDMLKLPRDPTNKTVDKKRKKEIPIKGTRSSKRTKLTVETADESDDMNESADESDIKNETEDESDNKNEDIDESDNKSIASAQDSKEIPSIDDCILLHASMNDPLRVLNDGPGIWMVEKLYNELKIKQRPTEENIIVKWQSMMISMHHDRNNKRANSCQDLIKDVLTICFASKSAEAQSVALLSAGWNFIPNQKKNRRRNKYGTQAIYTSGKWGKGGEEVSLQDAWDKYVSDISQEIDEQYKEVKERLTTVINTDKVNDQVAVKVKENVTPMVEDQVVLKVKEKVTPKVKEKVNAIKSTKPIDGKDVIFPDPNKKPVPLQSVTRTLLTYDELPRNIQAVFKARKDIVRKYDPRPIIHCTWCGPKLPEEETLKDETLCEACMMLYEEGHRHEREHYISKKKDMVINKYFNTQGKELRSVKLFLQGTSKFVSKIFSKAEEEDHMEMEDITNQPLTKGGEVKEKTSIGSNVAAATAADIDVMLDSSRAFIPSSVMEVKKNGVPKIQDLLQHDKGLAGTLRDDKFCILNVCYGSDITIAFRVLQPLLKGDFPSQVQTESESNYSLFIAAAQMLFFQALILCMFALFFIQ